MKETRKHSLLRYLILIFFILLYLFYTINKFGLDKGLLVTALTWSFFVFCTPIADAGFILALPARLLIGIRMLYTQIFAFGLAILFTLPAVLYRPEIFQKTLILKLYYQILVTPVPYWIIIILSLAGTFFSIYFGDELIDVSTHAERKKYHKHANKHKIIVSLSLFFMTLLVYNFLLHQIGVKIPLM